MVFCGVVSTFLVFVCQVLGLGVGFGLLLLWGGCVGCVWVFGGCTFLVCGWHAGQVSGFVVGVFFPCLVCVRCFVFDMG